MNNKTSFKEKVFRCIVVTLCGIVSIGVVTHCINEYVLDEDVSRIRFTKFNSEKTHIYPVITFCFSSHLLKDKLATYGEGINVDSYQRFLRGDLWDERMASINYDDVALKIEDYLLGKYTSFMSTYFILFPTILYNN